MRQITKITFVLVLIISFASCQTSKTGCYEFGEAKTKESKSNNFDSKTDPIFTNIVCKP